MLGAMVAFFWELAQKNRFYFAQGLKGRMLKEGRSGY